jgi:hypothetical protein
LDQTELAYFDLDSPCLRIGLALWTRLDALDSPWTRCDRARTGLASTGLIRRPASSGLASTRLASNGLTSTKLAYYPTWTGLAFFHFCFDWTLLLRLDTPSSAGLAWARLLRLVSIWTSTGLALFRSLAFFDWPRLLALASPSSTGLAFFDSGLVSSTGDSLLRLDSLRLVRLLAFSH